MATKLKNLVITKVALVDEGSCSAAHIKLYKRKKEGGEQIMGIEELLKLIPEDQREAAKAAIEKAKADAAKAAEDAMDGGIDDALENPDGSLKGDKKKAVTKVAARVAELNGEIAKLKAPATPNEDEILKSLDPAVRAIIEKSKAKAAAAEAAIIKMKEEADEAESIAKAKELPNLSGKVETLADTFKTIKKAAPESFDTIYDILKTAETMVAESGALGEIGANGGADDEALEKAKDASWNKIEKKAEEIAKSTAGLTKEAAIAKAIKQYPELYKEYLANLK